ncbi:MAG: Ldh family oxidoreductase [Ectothiorhodospiraceae bacterium]|nr:Ldh family oxidoreductase [Chromatiales bacterium]MCP5154831.1 Ldh family oxidoreductase [Ectothiorhodospiraceae bacterium]
MSIGPGGSAQASGKLVLAEGTTTVGVEHAMRTVTAILCAAGCPPDISAMVAEHLVDASLCGVDSHGVVRVLQYAEQMRDGYLDPAGRARIFRTERGVTEIDGRGGIGIPAMALAVDHVCATARETGVALAPVRNVGHTGRLGAFAETGADAGCLVLIIGGGGRTSWRQVAPYGGRKAVLPTNPYCLGIPGGERGPVVVDFATSMVAGGWLLAARAAGATLAEGSIIDAEGRPSRDPEAYFGGGAILPKGGPMGYGLAVMAEIICEAMLGPVTTEVNWLVLAVDTTRHREPTAMRSVAEEILAELRACPPAAGFERVEVPGERERARRELGRARGIEIPTRTWTAIEALATAAGRPA